MLESRLTTAADTFQTAEAKRFDLGRIDDATKTIERDVYDAPDAVEGKIAQAFALIDATPHLTAPEKEEKKRAARERLLVAGETGRIDADPAYALRLSRAESPDGRSNMAGSGAAGYFQFMPKTAGAIARRTSWGKDMTDEQAIAAIQEEVRSLPKGQIGPKQREMEGIYTADSNAALKKAGLPINDATRYALHAFGVGGGVSLLKADPGMKIGDWVKTVQWGVSPDLVLKQNALDPNKTVGDLQADLGRRIGGGSGGTLPAAGGAPAGAAPRRQLVGVPDGISLDAALKLRNYADARLKTLQSDAGENARLVEQEVMLGRRDPSELTGVANNYRRLGMTAQANYYDYLAGKPDLIRQWAQAGSEEQRAIITKSASPVAAGAEVASAERKRLLSEASKQAEGRFTTIEAALKGDAKLDQVLPQLQEVYAVARQSGNTGLVDKVEKLIGERRTIEQFRSMSSGTQSAILERATNQLAQDGGAPEAFVVVQKLEADHKAYVDALGKDAFSAGSDRFSLHVNPIASLSPTPQTISALQTRAAQARIVAAKEPTVAETIVPFTGDEMASLTARINAAPANQKVQMLGTLSAGLGPQMFAQTMKAMAKNGHGALAWAGGLTGVDPQAARTILEGQEVRKMNKGAVPQGADLTRAVDEVVGTTFRNSAEARAMVGDAVQAAYAKLAFDAGKMDGKYDSDLAAKAIKLTVGNIVSFRGEKMIAPTRETSEGGFRDAWGRLQDSDLPDLRSMEGDRIDAARIMRYGVPSSAGDGKYIVRLPDRGGTLKVIPDPNWRPDPRNPNEGHPPWILDMTPLLARQPRDRSTMTLNKLRSIERERQMRTEGTPPGAQFGPGQVDTGVRLP
jgi:hypothetical protein